MQRFLTPHWGLVRPFALGSGSQLRPALDHAAPSEGELAELLTLSAGLTDEHKAIAEYWAGGPGTSRRRACGPRSRSRLRDMTAMGSTMT